MLIPIAIITLHDIGSSTYLIRLMEGFIEQYALHDTILLAPKTDFLDYKGVIHRIGITMPMMMGLYGLKRSIKCPYPGPGITMTESSREGATTRSVW